MANAKAYANTKAKASKKVCLGYQWGIRGLEVSYCKILFIFSEQQIKQYNFFESSILVLLC